MRPPRGALKSWDEVLKLDPQAPLYIAYGKRRDFLLSKTKVLRMCPSTFKFWMTVPHDYIFANYWHARAYHLRMKKHAENPK